MTGEWKRADDDAGWEILDSDGQYRLVTDRAITLFGHDHVERMNAAYGLPPLPDEAVSHG